MPAVWFRPKRYGFGLTPATWQGWALTFGYVAAVAGGHRLLSLRGPPGWRMAVLMAVLTAGFIALVLRHSQGGWRWRWGDRE